LRLFPALLLLWFSASAQSDIELQLKRFADVYAAVEQHAADPVNPYQAMYAGAIPGMLRRLDPHSVFFDPGQFEQLKELEKSTHKGFGSVVSVLPGRVIVLQTLAGTPSARAGIQPGDEILAINGIRLDRLDLRQLVGLLGESRQREAKLDVRRPGNTRLLQFVLTPEEVLSPSVDRAFFLQPGVGYVRITSFEAETGKQVRQAIEKLGGKKLMSLVLDMRDNPGGLMPSALETAALFLAPGKKLLTVRGRAKDAEDISVPDWAQPYDFPMAVLVNGRTASGAEIVAGALQDHDRAPVIGEPSFGKGLVQSVYSLSSGTGLALTTAFYYTPSGRSIQKPLHGGQLDTATSNDSAGTYRTDSGRVVRGGGGIRPDYLVYPESPSRLRIALEATASFTSFATQTLHKLGHVNDGFEVTPALLDEFQVFCSQRNIRPGVSEWSSEREWIRSRLKQEIFNQSLGVEKGDEVEAQRDPQVLKALDVLKAG
jgi:carboxyl-terminal processing protease